MEKTRKAFIHAGFKPFSPNLENSIHRTPRMPPMHIAIHGGYFLSADWHFINRREGKSKSDHHGKSGER